MTKPFKICYETHGNSRNPCIILITGIGGQLIDWPSTLTQGLTNNGFYVVTRDYFCEKIVDLIVKYFK